MLVTATITSATPAASQSVANALGALADSGVAATGAALGVSIISLTTPQAVTAVVAGYVQPRVADYLTALEGSLAGAGVSARPMITKSNGGVMSAALGKTQCAQMLLSGTAAGVIGASYVARMTGDENTMSIDIIIVLFMYN